MYKCNNDLMKFSDDQIQQLKDIFATKDDLKSFVTKDDLKKSLAPIKRKLNAIQKDLSWTMLKYDSRLNHLEKHFVHPPGHFSD